MNDGTCRSGRLLRGRAIFSFVFVAVATCVLAVANHGLSQDDLQKMTPRVQDPAVAECVALGHKAATEGNFDQAIKLFSACIEKHPNSTDAHFFLGMAYFYKQDIDKAAGELRKSLQYDSNNLDASAMLGRIYSFDKQKLALSRELLERVISVAPHKDDVRFDLARVYALSGDEKKSLQEFRTIFLGEARYGVYHTEFAKILIAAGEKKPARTHLQRALALAPDFEPAKMLLDSLNKEDQGSALTPVGEKTDKKSP